MNKESNVNIETCVGCGSSRLHEFFRTNNSPVNVGSIPTTRVQALAAKTGEIELVFCSDCQLVYNRVFAAELVDFQPGYEVALSHSKVFLDFQTSVAERLTKTFDLHGKRILEIGCGDGVFLKMLCQRGGNQGVGIDPTVSKVGAVDLERGSATFIRGFFSEIYASEIGDFICCLSVFEAIPQPRDFLLMLRKMIGDGQPGIYFEVFNGFRSIDSGEIWSIHYEQCNYFSLTTLENLFRDSGFKITNSGTCYQGDQYLFVEAVVDPDFDSSHSESIESDAAPTAIPAVISEFSNGFRQRVEYWEDRLAQSKQANKSVVLWGSGGKGISFLNALSEPDAIGAVVDINPNRQGSFIPGTGHPIMAPEWLVQNPPELIILTNPIYESEIREQVADLNIDSEIDSI
jgi:hypothetical protein